MLENQQVIQNCRIGYRTLGKFNATKSNVILFATYFTGKSEDLVSYVGGKDKLLDSTRYFIILTDALGNGVSSSPSNSDLQPHGCQPSAPILSESKVDEDNLRRCCAPPLRAAVALIFQSSFAKIWQSIYCFA
ncbi:MAG: hypothetical protein RMJ87_12270 [Cytophagales bacterium]|nr:hypothetical protein [Cytophagales bacterium]